MSKAKKIMLGTMLAASLLGGKVAAQNSAATKAKAKTEQALKPNVRPDKEFRDAGVLVVLKDNDLIWQIDPRKFSEQVRIQYNALEKASFIHAAEYAQEMDADNPYNSKYFSPERLKFMRDEVMEAKRETTEYLLNLPLDQKKYEQVKGKLIALLGMTHDVILTQGMDLKNIKTHADLIAYKDFAHLALRISIARFIIKDELDNIHSINSAQVNAVTQKTK